MIPQAPISQREFVSRTRTLTNTLFDPELRYLQPEEFARAYYRLVRLLTNHPEMLSKRYVVHNLGRRRVAYLRELLGEVGNEIAQCP